MSADQTVPAGEQPDHFAELAAELHRVADDIARLAGQGLPKPRQFQLNIQPASRGGDDDLTARAVDAMANALLGHSAAPELMGHGKYFYQTGFEKRGPLQVVVYHPISTEWVERHHPEVVAADREAQRPREAERDD